MKSWKAESLLLMITFFWGATFLFTKIALSDSTPYVFTIVRFFSASIISYIIWKKHLKRFSKSEIKQGVVLGLLYGIGFVSQTFGLTLTTVSKSAFITGFLVVLAPFANYFIIKKPISVSAKIGVIIATVGLYIFANPDFGNINLGDALTLVSSVVWAIYIALLDVYTRDADENFSFTAKLVFVQFVVTALCGVISILIIEPTNWKFVPSFGLIGALAFNTIFASLITTTVQTRVQKFSNPVKASLIFALEPVIASALAVIFYNEAAGIREILGGGLLISGAVFSEIGENLIKKIKII